MERRRNTRSLGKKNNHFSNIQEYLQGQIYGEMEILHFFQGLVEVLYIKYNRYAKLDIVNTELFEEMRASQGIFFTNFIHNFKG